ncbi:MAG TPA: toll/interleukin-1 receptor domain-containing protein [Acidisarcina sp.]
MGHAIFISYRRDDSEGEAGRLFDDLSRVFGDSCVFMDVAGITPGTDFRKAIEENVVSCGVLLAVIGPSWVSIKDPSGNVRLHDPNDFVRLEIASALKRQVAVIPVLVHDAKMPSADAVPEDLKDLCYRNNVELSHARWNSDLALLTNAVRSYVNSTPANEQQPVHATVPVQLPAPHPPPSPEPAKKRFMGPRLQGAAAAAVVGLMLIGYAASHHGGTPNTGTSSDVTAQPDQSFKVQEQAEPARPDNAAVATDSKEESQQAEGLKSPSTASEREEKPDSAGAATDAAAAMGDGESGGPERLQGRWMATDRRPGNSLAYLEIRPAGNTLLVHAWGGCQPNACDWGTVAGVPDGTGVSATYGFPMEMAQTGIMRFASVKVMPGLNGLDVVVTNKMTHYGETRTNQIRLEFVPSR